MGLAASQARFLGITLRKANCEFKSTELAQQRLELTDQMTHISQEYANALNATKLVWHNEAVCDSFGNPADMGLSYGLLMMPSAANDYNPYMVSTRSGAIVLSSKYADAAKAAGISMGGGTASETGRNKFIASLANGTINFDNTTGKINKVEYTNANDNIITSTTCDALLGRKKIDSNAEVNWHSSAGMGAVPKDKGVADIVTLEDLKESSSIGQVKIDWLQIVRGMKGLGINDSMTEVQSERLLKSYNENIANNKLKYLNALDSNGNHFQMVDPSDSTKTVDIDIAYINEIIKDAEKEAKNVIKNPSKQSGSDLIDLMQEFEKLENLIKNSTGSRKEQYQKELEDIKNGLKKPDGTAETNKENEYLNPLYWSIYEKVKVEEDAGKNLIAWKDSEYANVLSTSGKTDYIKVDVSQLFQTSGSSVGNGKFTTQDASGNDKSINQFSVVLNDSICYSASEIQSLTIEDLLSQNISIITSGNDPINGIATAGKYLMEYLAQVFGLGHIGTGLNVDTSSDDALEFALSMVEKKFLSAGGAVKSGGLDSKSSMLSNSAYVNANEFNRIGATSNGSYAALNLSNMLSAFLTYYDNFLRGTDSAYVVGKGNTDGKTIFVTDDTNYSYVSNIKEPLSNEEKIADFYNELYNNICAHGWRYDDMVLDNNYLESAVKDGRYQLMALNSDGYFYQERYNDVGYMEEVQDKDAITRAEVDFTTKKAEITYKEDEIDIKTKKLDAEITELNTEINSVQNIISKSIEKTFSMFSN